MACFSCRYFFGFLFIHQLISCKLEEISDAESGWPEVAGYLYKNTSQKLTWGRARDYCMRHNATLLDFVGGDDILYLGKSNLNYWIGLRKNASNFVEVPRNMTDQLVFTVQAKFKSKKFPEKGVSSYYRRLPSICVRRRKGEKCDKDWTLDGNSCYVIVYEKMSWFGAYAHCKRLHSELYTGGEHEASIGSVLDETFWTGSAFGSKLDRWLHWQWSNGTTFQWKYRQIRMRYLGCSGCGYKINATLYLTSQPRCKESRRFFCQGELPDTSNVDSGSFDVAESHCKAKNRTVNLNTSAVGYSDHPYWIGIRSRMKPQDNCKTVNVGNGTNVTDFRLSSCSVVVCSNLNFVRYERCNHKLHPPVCTKEINTTNSDSCSDGWEYTSDQRMRIKTFQNLHMTWLAAYHFCRQQKGQLISLTMVEKLCCNESMKGRNAPFWADDLKTYAPQDPLEGWQWINGSQYGAAGYRGVLQGILHYNMDREKCAVVNPARGIWEDKSCTSRQHFICKKEILEQPSIPAQGYRDNEQSQADTLEISKPLIQLGSSEPTRSVEDLLSYIPQKIVEILIASSMPSFNITRDNFELVVNSTSFTNLRQLTSNITTIPIKTIEKMCQDLSSCIVKSMKMVMTNVTVNVSKFESTLTSQSTDVIGLDYVVDGQLVTELDGNETVSLNFLKKVKTKGNKVYCAFLNGAEWNTTGMSVGLIDKDSVECVTNHLTSFAVVVLRDESSETDKMALKFILYIGSALSLAGLLFTCAVYLVLYKDLQILTTSRLLVHFNLQVALGLTQVVFLAAGSVAHDEVCCKIVAILLHYFTLASFCWMLIEALMLYLKLISVYGGEFVKMRGFYAFGWGFPFIFVGLSSGVKIEAYGTGNWCWLSYEGGFYWVFFAPVIIVTAVTFVAIVAVARLLFHAAKAQASTKKYIIYAARSIVILFPTLGLSWSFSIIAVNHDAIIWKYLFTISTSIQGFLIFLLYGICNREIRAAVIRRMGRDVNPTSSTT